MKSHAKLDAVVNTVMASRAPRAASSKTTATGAPSLEPTNPWLPSPASSSAEYVSLDPEDQLMALAPLIALDGVGEIGGAGGFTANLIQPENY